MSSISAIVESDMWDLLPKVKILPSKVSLEELRGFCFVLVLILVSFETGFLCVALDILELSL